MSHSRLATNILLFLAVSLMPWWVTAGIVLVALTVFDHFYEVLIAGIVMDALYGIPATATVLQPFLFFATAATAFLLFELAKTHMRVFDRG